MIWEILGAIFDFFDLFQGRVTVADRYAMKRRVRALRKKEAARKAQST